MRIAQKSHSQSDTLLRMDIFLLAFAYILSQYYRSVLSILAPVLRADLGLSADALSDALGLWFLAFALMQFPVGWAFDKFGPRKTTSFIFMAAALGGLIFASATSASAILVAMTLLGVGCSPALMASYFIFYHEFSAKKFATFAGFLLAIGMVGNIAASLPTEWALNRFGWRFVMGFLTFGTFALSILLYIFIRPRAYILAANGSDIKGSDTKGGIIDIFKIRQLWFIYPLLFIQYAPAAGIRGVWMGPYLTDLFGATYELGWATFGMAITMIIGCIAYGPFDAIARQRKLTIILSAGFSAIALFLLAFFPVKSLIFSIILIMLIGFFVSYFSLLFAHARAFLPAHLAGRGMTLINFCGIGGVGLMQIVSSRIYTSTLQTTSAQSTAYGYVFLLFALMTVAGLAIYLFSEPRDD